MNRAIAFFIMLITQSTIVAPVMAGDFDWLNNLNIEARADMSGFEVNLASRFRIGGAEIKTVLRTTDKPADAYMVLRLSEMTRRPVSEVLRVYRPYKNRGWGFMAKKLGIKPGSREFHELKARHDDFRGGQENSGHHGNGKDREKHHGHGRGKH